MNDDPAGLTTVLAAEDLSQASAETHKPRRDHIEIVLLVILAIVLIVVVFANSWGQFSPDTKPSLYLDPGGTLLQSLDAWSPNLGQGGQANVDVGLAPIAAVVWLIRLVGFNAWQSMRVWRLLMYFTAAWGIRRWFGAVTDEKTNRAGRLAVTIFYVANPFVVVSGSTTPEMLPYALLPWMLFAQLRSLRKPTSWRAAALFALGFFAMSGANSGIIPLFLLLAVPCQMLYLRVTEGISIRALWSSAWRCGLLAFGLSVYWVVPSALALQTGAAIVAASESPLAVAQTSSWAEIARLQGLWPLYGRSGAVPWFSSYASYLTSPLVTVSSYLVAALAALGGWMARSRAILLVGILLAIGLPVMLGQFPPNSSLIWPRLVETVFADVPGAAGFRTTVKVGPVVTLAYALCIGLGVTTLAQRWRGWKMGWRWLVVVAAAVLEVTSVAPAFTGNLWSTSWEIPSYWQQAANTVGSAGDGTRVMLVPGSIGSNYRWGDTGPDDIVASIFSRPTISYTPAAAAGSQAANLMAAWDTQLNEATLPSGSLSVIARYVGATNLIVRNDSNYQAVDGVSPSVVASQVNSDPGLDYLRSYGQPGLYVTSVGHNPVPAFAPDASLAPVQLYAVTDPEPIIRTQPVTGPVLIDGDGFAVPTLANLGVLTGSQPFMYMGGLTSAELSQDVADGASVVITDTNRRRSWGKNHLGDAFGPTLAANQPISTTTGPSFTLFQTKTYTQTVTKLIGASSITGTAPLFGLEPYGQPEQAFDPSPSSPWLTGGFGATGMKLKITFLKPLPVDELQLNTGSIGPSTVTSVKVQAGNETTSADLDAQTRCAGSKSNCYEIHLAPTFADSLTVTITGVSSGINQVGFTNVNIEADKQGSQVPIVHVSQMTVMPTTFDRLYSQASSKTKSQLSSLPLYVLMTRQQVGSSLLQDDEEVSMNRQFELPAKRTFVVNALLHGIDYLPPGVLAALENSPPGGATRICFPIGTIDGTSLRMQLDEPISQAEAGGQVMLSTCNQRPLTLSAGTHDFMSASTTEIDQFVLASPGSSPSPTESPPTKSPPVQVLSSSATKFTLHVGASTQPYYLIAGQSPSPGWAATMDGHKLGPPIAIDGYTFGWRIDSPGPHTIVLAYGPQFDTEVCVAVSLVLLLGVVVFIGVSYATENKRRARRGAHRRRS